MKTGPSPLPRTRAASDSLPNKRSWNGRTSCAHHASLDTGWTQAAERPPANAAGGRERLFVVNRNARSELFRAEFELLRAQLRNVKPRDVEPAARSPLPDPQDAAESYSRSKFDQAMERNSRRRATSQGMQRFQGIGGAAILCRIRGMTSSSEDGARARWSPGSPLDRGLRTRLQEGSDRRRAEPRLDLVAPMK